MIFSTIGSSTHADNTGGATPTYTSITAANAGIANTDNETITGITKVAPLQSTSSTLNASNGGSYVYLLTADSSTYVNAPTHAAATANARCVGSGERAIVVSGTGWVIEKITIISGSGGDSIRLESATTVRRCGLLALGGDKNFSVAANGQVIENCFGIYGDIGVLGGTCSIYQCSFLPQAGQSPRAALTTIGAITAYGVISQGSNSQGDYWDLSGGFSGDYNVSADTTAVGSNSLHNKSGVYTNSSNGTEDLSLSGSVAVNIVDRSGFPSDTDTDIVGTTRPSTGADAGVWQTPSAPPPSNTNPPDNTVFSRRGKGRTFPTPSTIGH